MAQLAEQPTATTPRIGKQGDPCVMVIFGAAGDLTARLLIPALYNLARADLLSKEFAVLGVARKQLSDEDFRKQVLEDVKEYCGDCINDATWESFSRRFYYFAGDFGDAQLYPKIKERLAKIMLEDIPACWKDGKPSYDRMLENFAPIAATRHDEPKARRACLA